MRSVGALGAGCGAAGVGFIAKRPVVGALSLCESLVGAAWLSWFAFKSFDLSLSLNVSVPIIFLLIQ